MLNYFTTESAREAPRVDYRVRTTGGEDRERLAAIDADVFGLIEIENSATDAAVATLMTALNDTPGSRDLCLHPDR